MPSWPSPRVLVWGAAGVVLARAAYRLWIRRSRDPLPPGPPKAFIIGNLRHVPRTSPCLTYEHYGHTYGPLTFLEVLGRKILIITDYQAATDLLDKRGQKYSDRPRFVMAGELAGLNTSTIFAPFNATWKKHRRFLHYALNPKTVQENYAGLQEQKAYEYVLGCLDKPGAWMEGIKRMTGEAATTIAYGTYRDDTYDYVDVSERLALASSKMIGGYLVEMVPWLKYVPEWFLLAKFKKEAREWRETCEWGKAYFVEGVRKKAADGSPMRPSYVSTMLAEHGDDEDDVAAISNSAWAFYRAGNDTTISALKAFTVAMALYPEIQTKAHEELDRVLSGRIPTLQDRESLPYITSLVLETLRWIPPVPAGLPHRLMEDDSYLGYFIPAGTTVIANIWSIARNEDLFPSADTFNPDRYAPNFTTLDPRLFVFGFGRRICPGIHLAFQGLWISIATTLWSFDIQNQSKNGLRKDCDSRRIFKLGLTSEPSSDFACDFVPRSERTRERIVAALKRE